MAILVPKDRYHAQLLRFTVRRSYGEPVGHPANFDLAKRLGITRMEGQSGALRGGVGSGRQAAQWPQDRRSTHRERCR